jgi:hypothetical protein
LLDVKCADEVPMKTCADLALQMIDRLQTYRNPDFERKARMRRRAFLTLVECSRRPGRGSEILRLAPRFAKDREAVRLGGC